MMNPEKEKEKEERTLTSVEETENEAHPIDNTVHAATVYDLHKEGSAPDATKDDNPHYTATEDPFVLEKQSPINTENAQNHVTGETAKLYIAELEEKLALTKDQLMRSLAEMENLRRRSQREREDASKFAISSFARDLLSVSDNLRRALEAVPPEILDASRQVRSLFDGISATERELMRSFDRHGIQIMLPIDMPFDPNFHEVMFEADIPGKPTGTIIQVVEAGYTLNGRILRPARVGVSKSGDTTPTSGQGGHVDTQA